MGVDCFEFGIRRCNGFGGGNNRVFDGLHRVDVDISGAFSPCKKMAQEGKILLYRGGFEVRLLTSLGYLIAYAASVGQGNVAEHQLPV